MDEAWLTALPGVREQEPLSRHSWYGIGGPARYFLELTDDALLDDLVPRLNQARKPFVVIGAASNTLFADEGFEGLVIKVASQQLQLDGETLEVGAGYLMPRLALETCKAGLAGLEFGAGVPGSVGGSLVGNAGAFGREVKDCLIEARAIDPQGRRQTLPASLCNFQYRDSTFKSDRRGWVIIAARFRASREEPALIRDRIRRVQRHRRETQPIEKRSLGSTFKNPPGEAAGRLVEACGLKGTRIGGAQISPKHANFIVNLGQARASDVLALMAEMRDRVRDRFGIELEPEVRVIGRGGGG